MPKFINKVIIFVLFVCLLFLLYQRFQLGMVRYFDIDEFAYLHWAYNLSVGLRPYSDFFMLVPPFFLYPLALLMIILGRNVVVLIEARVVIFLFFCLSGLVLFLIGKVWRSIKFGLLTACIFSFLPLPYDKMIEIRPDLPALFFALLGMFFIILAFEKRESPLFFASGFSYAFSLVFIPKTVFFLIPPLLIFAYQFRKKKAWRQFLIFIFAAAIPALIAFAVIIGFGNFPFALYSMTKLASNVHKTLASKFYMLPNLFFYPNETYYGEGGVSLPLVVNLLLYLLAILAGIVRFLGSFSHKEEKKCIVEFIISATFLLNLFAFIKYYPLKHAQYLIFVAPFVAFYAAQAVEGVVIRISGSCRSGIPNYDSSPFGRPSLASPAGKIQGLILIIFVLFLILVTEKMNRRKFTWTNQSTIKEVEKLLSLIPKDESVFDLTGGSVFLKTGYFFCCLPYGQYEEVFGFKMPDLEKELERRKTKFVYTGNLERLDVLPSYQSKFIRDNFRPILEDGSLLIRK